MLFICFPGGHMGDYSTLPLFRNTTKESEEDY
jgi:hypothetical protein